MSSAAPESGLDNSTVASAEPSQSPHPLFSDPAADVILRSVDNVDFCFYKTVLLLLSSVFHDMFSLPRPKDSASSASVDVVPVAEEAKALALLLTWCHPRMVKSCSVESLEEVTCLLTLAEKYDMESVRERVEEKILASPASLDPVRLYCVAYRFKLEDIARASARKTLSRDTKSLMDLASCPEMEIVPGTAFATLSIYHNQCAEAAQRSLSSNTPSIGPFSLELNQVLPTCATCPGISIFTVKPQNAGGNQFALQRTPRWVHSYLQLCQLSLARGLDLDNLDSLTLDTDEGYEELMSSLKGCTHCRSRLAFFQTIPQLNRQIKRLVNTELSKVELRLPWALSSPPTE